MSKLIKAVNCLYYVIFLHIIIHKGRRVLGILGGMADPTKYICA